MPAAPSSVLLLGWDETSAALPLARALTAATATELWTARPLAAAPAGTRHRSLDQAPPLPALPGLGQRVPAFPYVGRSENQAPSVAVPAAPYLGSSQAPPPARPAGPAPALARTSLPARGEQPFGVPAAPYQGATPAAPGFFAPPPRPDYRVPVAPLLPAPAVPSPPPAARAQAPAAPAAAGTAEPGPAEAAELSGLLPDAPLPTETAAERAPEAGLDSAIELAVAAEPAPAAEPALAAEAAPEPLATEADPAGLDLDDLALLAAEPDAAALNFRIIQYARHAARLAHESAFDVIFAPDWHTWLAGVELRQLTRRPLVLQVTQLASELASPAARGWAEALERLTLPRADRILVPDEALAVRLRQRYRLPAERVMVVAPGAAPDLGAALVLDSRFSL